MMYPGGYGENWKTDRDGEEEEEEEKNIRMIVSWLLVTAHQC